MKQPLKLSWIQTENTVFGRKINVFCTEKTGSGRYKQVKKEGLLDYYQAEKLCFDKDYLLIRDKIISYKDSLIYLTKFGYLKGGQAETARQAIRVMNEQLRELTSVHTKQEDVIEAFEHLAYCVKMTKPVPESTRFNQFKELESLLIQFSEKYSVEA